MPDDVLTGGLRAFHVMLMKARELAEMEPEKEALRFTEQDQQILLRCVADVSNDEASRRRLTDLRAGGLVGLLRAAAAGHSFVPSSRIPERFGRTLSTNYPEANSTFLKFANGYWTFKLLASDV